MATSYGRYYQLEGWGAHTKFWCNWNLEALCEHVFQELKTKDESGRESVELVLGIYSSGASYIHIPANRIEAVRNRIASNGLPAPLPSRPPPRYASDFASMSPITFNSVSELFEKLKRYRVKPKRKNNEGQQRGGKTSQGRDTSAENDRFLHVDAEAPETMRSEYERQRILWRVLRGELDRDKYALPDMPWTDKPVVRAMMFNTWDADDRKGSEQERDPRLLDIAWVDALAKSILEGRRYTLLPTRVDLIVKEFRMLKNNGQPRAEFILDEATETVDKQTVYSRLRQHFNGPFENPLILLVYNKKVALNIFKVAGVDTTGWRMDGLRDLLIQSEHNFRPGRQSGNSYGSGSGNLLPTPGPSGSNNPYTSPDLKPGMKQEYDSKSNVRVKSEQGVKQESTSHGGHQAKLEFDRKPTLKRSRSPSPDKRNVKRPRSPVKDERARPSPGPSSSSNSNHPGPQPNNTVHVIDVKELFRVLSDIYAPLEYAREALGVELHRSGWCAGNTCLDLVQVWRDMAEGPPIVVPRKLIVPGTVVPDPDEEEENEEEDEEADPNDAPVLGNARPIPRGLEFMEADEDDW